MCDWKQILSTWKPIRSSTLVWKIKMSTYFWNKKSQSPHEKTWLIIIGHFRENEVLTKLINMKTVQKHSENITALSQKEFILFVNWQIWFKQEIKQRLMWACIVQTCKLHLKPGFLMHALSHIYIAFMRDSALSCEHYKNTCTSKPSMHLYMKFIQSK